MAPLKLLSNTHYNGVSGEKEINCSEMPEIDLKPVLQQGSREQRELKI